MKLIQFFALSVLLSLAYIPIIIAMDEGKEEPLAVVGGGWSSFIDVDANQTYQQLQSLKSINAVSLAGSENKSCYGSLQDIFNALDAVEQRRGAYTSDIDASPILADYAEIISHASRFRGGKSNKTLEAILIKYQTPITREQYKQMKERVRVETLAAIVPTQAQIIGERLMQTLITEAQNGKLGLLEHTAAMRGRGISFEDEHFYERDTPDEIARAFLSAWREIEANFLNIMIRARMPAVDTSRAPLALESQVAELSLSGLYALDDPELDFLK